MGNDGAPDLTTLDVRQSLAPLIAAALRARPRGLRRRPEVARR
ncbi:MAG: hypothetical protein R3F11_09580 [Verrucomicrobiales bacterium]